MGKTRDLFKKIRDTKGTFHAKMGSIKDRNGRDLINKKRSLFDHRHISAYEAILTDVHVPYFIYLLLSGKEEK